MYLVWCASAADIYSIDFWIYLLHTEVHTSLNKTIKWQRNLRDARKRVAVLILVQLEETLVDQALTETEILVAVVAFQVDAHNVADAQEEDENNQPLTLHNLLTKIQLRIRLRNILQNTRLLILVYMLIL